MAFRFKSLAVPAQRFLAGLDAANGDLFAELAGAVGREQACITPPYLSRVGAPGQMFVDNDWAAALQRLAGVYRLRAAAAAQAGDGARTAESIAVLRRLSDGVHSEIGLLGGLVAIAIDAITAEAVWEAVPGSMAWRLRLGLRHRSMPRGQARAAIPIS